MGCQIVVVRDEVICQRGCEQCIFFHWFMCALHTGFMPCTMKSELEPCWWSWRLGLSWYVPYPDFEHTNVT